MSRTRCLRQTRHVLLPRTRTDSPVLGLSYVLSSVEPAQSVAPPVKRLSHPFLVDWISNTGQLLGVRVPVLSVNPIFEDGQTVSVMSRSNCWLPNA